MAAQARLCLVWSEIPEDTFFRGVAHIIYAALNFLAIYLINDCPHKQYEPPHDKTNKMTVRPAKTQISLSIHPV